jgi:hypothetical protein
MANAQTPADYLAQLRTYANLTKETFDAFTPEQRDAIGQTLAALIPAVNPNINPTDATNAAVAWSQGNPSLLQNVVRQLQAGLAAANQPPRQQAPASQVPGGVARSRLAPPDFGAQSAPAQRSQAPAQSMNLNLNLGNVKEGNAGISRTLVALSLARKQGATLNEANRNKLIRAMIENPLHDANDNNIFQPYINDHQALTEDIATALVRSLTAQSGMQSIVPGSNVATSDFLTGKILVYTVPQKESKAKEGGVVREPLQIRLILARKPTTAGLSGDDRVRREEELLMWKRQIKGAYGNKPLQLAQLKFIQDGNRVARKIAKWFLDNSDGDKKAIALIRTDNTVDVAGKSGRFFDGRYAFSLQDYAALVDYLDLLFDNYRASLHVGGAVAKTTKSFTGSGVLLHLGAGLSAWLNEESFGLNKCYTGVTTQYKADGKVSNYSMNCENPDFWAAIRASAVNISASELRRPAGEYERVLRALAGGETLIEAGYAQKHTLKSLFYLASFFGLRADNSQNAVFGKNNKETGFYAGLALPKKIGPNGKPTGAVNPSSPSQAMTYVLFPSEATKIYNGKHELELAPVGTSLVVALQNNKSASRKSVFDATRLSGNTDENDIITLSTYTAKDGDDHFPAAWKSVVDLLGSSSSVVVSGVSLDAIRNAVYAESEAVQMYVNSIKAARAGYKSIKA